MNSKDKRIKKIKKKGIGSAISGLFGILFIFIIFFVLVCFLSVQSILTRKLMEGVGETDKVFGMLNEYEGNDKQNIQDTIKTYLEMSDETEAVYISDLKGNKSWSSNELVPDITNKVNFSLLPWDRLDELDMYFEGEEHDEDELMYYAVDSFFESEGDELVRIKAWVLHETDEYKIYILQNFVLYEYDSRIMAVNLLLFVVLMLVFTLYYLQSVVNLVLSNRRTSKVLYTDMITGGNNWLYFVKKGNKYLGSRFNNYNYAVIHFKMRKYRSFCTCFGVNEAEVLIENLYKVIKKSLSRKELVVHKENAAFCLLLTYVDEQELCARIENLTVNLNALLPNMKLYFAAGIYKTHGREADIEQLYNNAVLACDMLGEEAENKIVFYDVEMNNRRLWERKVEDDMHSALVNHEFQVYLQPKISTDKESLAGAEALVRWIHPREGFIPPNKFIPIFERNGFILKLDDYMLEEIAKQQAEWISQGRKVVPISVNVSRAHFAKEDLAEHICSIVDKYQVPHNVIELELTESAFFDDKQVLLQTVKKLRESGFVVSMDDFGAGYSSLNSLKELQLDVLKLDADFFRGTDEIERGMVIVSEVIGLAKKLNMKIVAEGIENREQVDFLAAQECDLIQGYFYAKPMPICEFEEKYKEA